MRMRLNYSNSKFIGADINYITNYMHGICFLILDIFSFFLEKKE